MAQRTLPGIGLIGFWDLGYDGWKAENDGNLRIVSALVQASVLSIVAATPGAPVDGDMHIFSDTHPTEPNKIAIRDDGSWVYVAPRLGAFVYNQDTGTYFTFDGLVWVPLTIASSVAIEESHFLESQASGNSGGDGAAAWTTRVLNTTIRNDIVGCNLAANQITLDSGTYQVDARVPCYGAAGYKSRLRNVTDGTTILSGTTSWANVATEHSSRLAGSFTLSGTKTLAVQMIATGVVSSGWGANAGITGETNIYTNILLRKI
jgi:hypothetical protein